jgi:hypothetical protein
MMNAKSFNSILCPNYFCKLGSVILFYKNDESVKKSFDILTIYEKASGSKFNYEKTKSMYIGSAKNLVYRTLIY